jgi:hypothetical protein
MMGLLTVLRQYGQVQLGTTLDQEPVRPLDLVSLQKDLRSVVAASDKFLLMWLTALIMIFGLDVFVVLRELANPKLIGATFAATGVGFAAVLAQMRRLWHEKFTTQTLISLLPVLAPGDLKNVVMKLLSALVKG